MQRYKLDRMVRAGDPSLLNVHYTGMDDLNQYFDTGNIGLQKLKI